jgi:hypothetical protein
MIRLLFFHALSVRLFNPADKVNFLKEKCPVLYAKKLAHRQGILKLTLN